MTKKILYVIDGLEFGGGERVFAQIINGLPEDRFETFLATATNAAIQRSITARNCSFFPIDFSNRCNALNLLKLAGIIKNQQVDIVHGQGARAEFYARLAARISGRKKYVSSVAMPVEGYDVGAFRGFFYRVLDRFSERFVDCFLVVSSALERDMIQTHGVAAKKVVKIYNGIETDHYNPDAQEEGRRGIRREFSVNEREILIGSLGRMVWQKGFEYFVRGIPAILQEIPEAKFMLVGEGPLRRDMENLSVSLNIRDQLVFTGYRSDIRDMLSAMDVVVIPSVLEGFPMITLEVMAMEKPIVATAIDGIAEQIENGKEGLLVAPQNPQEIVQAVKRLLNDPDYARLLGANARTKVIREFSVQKMITQTIDVYEKLCRR
ncbi:MAG: glycosyltransferase family 4 protein [Bacteroidales bacterium]|nr:glycosyltransferase family 4 protein [Bacteroidales bacterium]